MCILSLAGVTAYVEVRGQLVGIHPSFCHWVLELELCSGLVEVLHWVTHLSGKDFSVLVSPVSFFFKVDTKTQATKVHLEIRVLIKQKGFCLLDGMTQ